MEMRFGSTGFIVFALHGSWGRGMRSVFGAGAGSFCSRLRVLLFNQRGNTRLNPKSIIFAQSLYNLYAFG